MSVESEKYIIIGGAPKAGSTSLYKWLSDHPQVLASSMKETRFFLDLGSRLPSASRYDGKNLQEYGKYFHEDGSGNSRVRLDATPDYLYSRVAPEIANLLPNAKIVFVIRDPVERMVSWYKFARQRHLIPATMSFHDYVTRQLEIVVDPSTPIHFQALEQCRYEKYLANFVETFGARCLILDFEQLTTDPRSVMSEICALAGIDDDFFERYEFTPENVSREFYSGRALRVYSDLRRTVAQSLHTNPLLFKLLRIPNRILKSILSMKARRSEKVVVSSELADLINAEAKK